MPKSCVTSTISDKGKDRGEVWKKEVVNDVWHERIHENVIDYLILNLKEKRREVNREWSGAR
jgi:hypothetical protein